VAPECWYSYSKRQRSCIQTCICLGVLALIVGLGMGIMLWAVLTQNSGGDGAKESKN
jgi:hypothetical protein